MKKLDELIDERFNFEEWNYSEKKPVNLEEVRILSWRSLEPARDGRLGQVPFCSYGDYDNSGSVERSNYRVFMEMFRSIDGIYEVLSGWDGHSIMVDLEKLNENQEIIDVIAGLNDYPVIDEEDMCRIEMEMEKESWESWIRSDLEKAIINFVNDDDFEIPEDLDLWPIYLELKEKTNTYFEVEGGGNG